MYKILIWLFKSIMHKNNVHTHYIKKHLIEFSKIIGGTSTVLDIGCRNSPYKDFFQFKKYIRLDINKYENLEIVGDVCNLPIKSNSIDTILFTEVLEHVKNTNFAIKEINRVLKNEGHLILTVPFIIPMHENRDFFRFTDLYLTEILKSTGFKICKIKKRGGIFATIIQLIADIPLSMIGPYINIKSLPKTLLKFLLILILVPLVRFFIIIDYFDKNKKTTLGYDMLCIKKEAKI